MPKKLKDSAPEGTVWFGGPIDKSTVSLRISGKNLNPDRISKLLNCMPSKVTKPNNTVVWLLESSSAEDMDIEDQIWEMLKKFPTKKKIWDSITSQYEVDLFCGLFLEAENRGFGLSVKLMKKLSFLGIEIGFDIYA